MTNMVYIISAAAKAVGVSPALLIALCFQESSLKNVVNPHDGLSASLGVCQVKASTAQLVERGTHPTSLMIPSVNARIAAKYLKKQIKRYGGNVWCGVNAYNVGRTRNCTKTINTNYVRLVRKHMELLSWKQKL